MNYYPSLLNAIFKSASGGSIPVSIAVSGAFQNPQPGEPGHADAYELPSKLLPPETSAKAIEGIEEFPDTVFRVVSEAHASCVFVFAPLVSRYSYSRDWRDRFGHCELAEILAETLLHGPRPTPNERRQRNNLQEDLLFGPKAQLETIPPPKVECVVLLVPRHLTSSMHSADWRQEFFPNHSTTIIEHDHPGVPESIEMNIHPGIPFSTLVFRPGPGPIRFFKITDAAVAEGPERIAKDLGQLLRQPAGKTRYGYVYQGALDEGYPCSYDYYSEETEKLRQEVAVLGEKVPLSSVAEVFCGVRIVPPGRVGTEPAGFLTIGARDITADGRVDLSDIRPHPRPAVVRSYLQDGDFCVREFSSANGRLMIGVFEGDGRAITANPNVIIVRPSPALTPPQRQVLLSFLRSPIGYRLANAKQTFSQLHGVVRIMPRVLAEFPVPLADDELASSIQGLNEARDAFVSWIEAIDQESNAIIEEATAAGSRKRLLGAGRLARQRHRAGEQVEELDYRIRTQFPHPLAYAWRKLQVAGNDRYHRLDAVLQAAENHTCFLALVAILISRSVNQPLKSVDEIAKRLSSRKSGTNFGDWLAILQELNGKAFRPQKGIMPFTEVADVHADKAWSSAITKLKTWRDDDCHGRISTTNVPATLLKEAEEALEQVYRATEFLTDYRFLFITETRFDSIRKINRYHFLDLTGDNTLAQRREDQADRADLESQSLYLMDRQGQLHLFRPLLHYLECPECHLMSTFFLDTFDSNESGEYVGLKSFETNSVRREKVAEEFRHVGLLPGSQPS
jgi:hypothetical protein